MFVEMLKAAAFIFISGVFCGVYAQSKEAVIRLDSPEQIERLQKILEDEPDQKDEFAQKAGEPAAGDDMKTEMRRNGNSAAAPRKKDLKEPEFKVFIPSAKEVPADGIIAGTGEEPAPGADKEEFQVFIPEAKEESPQTGFMPAAGEEQSQTGASGSRVKKLDSPEDMAEFKELLKNARFE